MILDGGFELENGIKVVGANGVAVENMTARNYVGNGFFWTGVTGYRASYLTAYRNGDYGIYAFDSVKGQFDHSYASGHPDSGFYIGQCYPCDAVITDVIAEHSQMGYSGTNAGGNLLIVSSIWRHNRIGIVPNTLDSEEEPPQREVVIAGNLVYDNNDPDAPNAKSSDFDILFGSGITVVGGVGDVVERNRVEGHELFGIVIAPNPGLQENFWPSQRNQVRDNVVRGSGMADLAIALFSPDDGNCFAGNDFGTSAPANLEQLMPCEGAGSGDPEAGAADVEAVLGATHPKGKPWQESPIPPDQPNMPDAATAEPRPATDVPMRVDLASITVPDPQG
ncbi:MAG: right-handed parallel beta-helix repeat-containing protein [Acidimicrobiia bacterium]|nr:right-handed parallel beta-helix repeat-containing protein [Acidimicrobiia bacterium]